MKLLLGMALGLFAITSLHAQTNIYKQRHNNFLHQFLQTQTNIPRVAAKTTGIIERLKSMSTYSVLRGRNVLIDSGLYMYSGANTSSYDFMNMSYDYAQLPNDLTSPPLYMASSGPNNLPSIQYDSLFMYTIPAGTVALQSMYRRYYSGGFVMQTSVAYNDTESYNHVLSYNSDGNVALDVAMNRIGGLYDTSFISYYLYNASKQLILDSFAQNAGPIVGIVSYFKSVYSYNTAGQLVTANYFDKNSSGVWINDTRFSLTYNAGNKINTMIMDTGVSLTHLYIDSFGYTPGIDYYTTSIDSTWSGTGWQFDGSSIKYMNLAGIPDSVIAIYSNVTRPGAFYKQKDVFTYTSSKKPLTDIDTLTSTVSSVVGITINNYYYETHTTAIPVVDENTYTVQTYPNPATDILFIKISGTVPINRILLDIYNENGQILKRADLINANDQSQICISDLAPGMYYVSIHNGNGSLIKTQVVIKR